MVGASVAFCIEDLARGNYRDITVEKVEAIFVDRDYKSPEETVAFCRKYFWSGCEDAAEAIFWQLHKSGRIRQPEGRKYGCKLLAWPSPKWFGNYKEFRERQMRHGNQRYIELLENEQLHTDLLVV